jgi:SOS-response transcriptional repressor LexA
MPGSRNLSGSATTLSPRQRKAVDFIGIYTARHGYSPAFREVQIAIGHSSISSTHHLLQKLRDLGVVTWSLDRPVRALSRR